MGFVVTGLDDGDPGDTVGEGTTVLGCGVVVTEEEGSSSASSPSSSHVVVVVDMTAPCGDGGGGNVSTARLVSMVKYMPLAAPRMEHKIVM